MKGFKKGCSKSIYDIDKIYFREHFMHAKKLDDSYNVSHQYEMSRITKIKSKDEVSNISKKLLSVSSVMDRDILLPYV